MVLLEVSDKGEILREIDSYHGLREPSVPINPQAHAVHGLTVETLRGRRWDTRQLRRIIDSADLLVAHNAKFDRRMLGQSMPHLLTENWACTMHSLKYDWAKLCEGKWALDTICAALQIQRQQPHDAMADCRALQAVLMARTGKTSRSKTLMAKLLNNPWAPAP